MVIKNIHIWLIEFGEKNVLIPIKKYIIQK